MAIIFWEGVLITIFVLTGLREQLMDAIPMSLKRAIAVGIGLFILLIGLVEGGFVVGGGGTPLGLGALNTPAILVFLLGLFVALALMARKVRGALLISIIAATIFAVIIRAIFPETSGLPPGAAQLPDHWLTDFGADDPFSTVLAPLTSGALWNVWTNPQYSVITIGLTVFSLMLSDFFDTMGTVIGVGEEAGLVKEGRLPGIRNVLLVDSIGAVLGGLFSTSSNTTYIESAAGVSDGGRTGLVAVVVGFFFLLAILFAPLIAIVPAQATAPALVVVGYLMFTIAKEIDWTDIDDLFPALVTIVVMPFTYTITDGIAAGFITFVFLKVVKGKTGEIHPLLWLASGAFVLYFAIPWIQQTFNV
jgi:AGZA family xanthine/uracil permease-like MFS transporter